MRYPSALVSQERYVFCPSLTSSGWSEVSAVVATVTGFDQFRPSSWDVITLTLVFSPSNSFHAIVVPRGPASTYGRVGLRSARPIGTGSENVLPSSSERA